MTSMGLRSAMASGARYMVSASRSNSSSSSSSSINVASKLLSSPILSSSSRRPVSSAFRLASMLGMVESQKPLHSAIASARLISVLAVDTRCWSCLSQGFALPL